MKIKKNLTINLSEKEVRNIISNFLRMEGYNVFEDDVEMLVTKKYTEDYDERFQQEILCFEGCIVHCIEK